MNRREAMQGMLAFCAACGGKRNGPADTGLACASSSTGTTLGYCLVENLSVRVTGAAALAVGESMIGVVDENTAVLVGRDAGGFYARSAVCTHACCVVVLCGDEACSSLSPTPDSCGTAGPSAADRVLCPCHGSTFRVSDGTVLTGPATQRLPSYAAVVDGADVLVDSGSEVGIDARATS